MIDTPKAIKELEDAGLTPVTFPDPKNPCIDHIFIKSEVVWAKLISAIRQDKKLTVLLDTIPHVRLLERLLIKHNPELQRIEFKPGLVGYGIKFEAIIDKRGRVPRIDRASHCYFQVVQKYISPLFNKFLK